MLFTRCKKDQEQIPVAPFFKRAEQEQLQNQPKPWVIRGELPADAES